MNLELPAGPPSEGDTQALLDAHWEWNKVLAGLIDAEVRPLIETVAKRGDKASGAILALLMRVTAWLKTAEKLREPSDFQAIAAGVRSLFEISVDLTLLHHDREGHPIVKMLAWNDSARLKSAVNAKRFVEKNPLTIPAMVQPMLDFIERNQSRIEGLRLHFWPDKSGKTGAHPPRWTGRPLDQDAIRADRLAPRKFVEFYALRYSWICWYVHGSVLAGVGGMEQRFFHQFMMFSLYDLAPFATTAAEMALKYLNQWNQGTKELFSKLASRQKETIHTAFKAHPARTTPFGD